MGKKVSAADLDFVKIDQRLVGRAVDALETARRTGLKVVTANLVPVAWSPPF